MSSAGIKNNIFKRPRPSFFEKHAIFNEPHNIMVLCYFIWHTLPSLAREPLSTEKKMEGGRKEIYTNTAFTAAVYMANMYILYT